MFVTYYFESPFGDGIDLIKNIADPTTSRCLLSEICWHLSSSATFWHLESKKQKILQRKIFTGKNGNKGKKLIFKVEYFLLLVATLKRLKL